MSSRMTTYKIGSLIKVSENLFLKVLGVKGYTVQYELLNSNNTQ